MLKNEVWDNANARATVSNYGRTKQDGILRKYARNNSGYINLSCPHLSGKTSGLHEVVMHLHGEPNPDPLFFTCIDHMKGLEIKYPYQIDNLRHSNYFLNNLNKETSKNCSFCVRDQSWVSHVKVFGKTVHIGSYGNDEEFAQLVGQMARQTAYDFILRNRVTEENSEKIEELREILKNIKHIFKDSKDCYSFLTY